ncbi:hypothetical protein ACS0TY_024366 [Phlomoides rotata]
MKGLFKSKPKTPADLVRQTRDLLIFVDHGGPDTKESKRDEKTLYIPNAMNSYLPRKITDFLCNDRLSGHWEMLPDTKLPMLTNATWTLSNFCKGKPQPIFEQVKPTLPALQHLVHSNDEEVLTYACWALSFLSDGTNDKIQVVIDACVCKRLVELLLHPSPSVLIPALRTIGNIVTGDDLQTQNITAGNINSPSLLGIEIKYRYNLLLYSGDLSSWLGRHLVTLNCIKPLCDLLICPDARIVTVCLEGLDNYLRVGKAEKGNTGGVNYFAQLIDEADGSKKIENLQTHDNTEIYEKAMRILEAYWQVFYENLPFHLLNLLSRFVTKCKN